MLSGLPKENSETRVVLPFAVHVAAVWASPAEEVDASGQMGGSFGYLIGWIPNGEPDVADPDLVNRIF